MFGAHEEMKTDLFQMSVDYILLNGTRWSVADHSDAAVIVTRNEARFRRLVPLLRKAKRRGKVEFDVVKSVKKMRFDTSGMYAERFVAYMLDIGLDIHDPQAD